MSMVVRTNINSMNANRNLSINNSQVAKAIEKLASGYAINRAADDASGLAITEKMQAQITGLDQGTDNALEGIGLVQTAEGAMSEIHDMLNRIVELSTKSANGTIQDEVDREAVQAEVDVLVDEIDRIAQSTNYNGIDLLDGSLAIGEHTVYNNRTIEITSTETTTETTVTVEFDSQLIIDETKSTTVGSFTITGGDLGTDFDYDSSTGQLIILSSTDMCIEGGSSTESIRVDDSAGSANLLLKNVNIISSFASKSSAFYTGSNDVYIELEGTNELSSTYGGHSNDGSVVGTAGLNVGENGSITIDGVGELTAMGGYYSAGIGSSVGESGGDIIINGGTINAGAYTNGTGIGSGGYGSSIGTIIINGGIITANSNSNGAGIGSGSNGTTGDILINGGTINAISGLHGAGIGSGGYGGTTGDITITGGTIVAESVGAGSGIGTGALLSTLDGSQPTAGNITITGGNITATAPVIGIGASANGIVGDITYVEEIVNVVDSQTVVGAVANGTVGDITTIPYTPSTDDVIVDGDTTITTTVNGNTTTITTETLVTKTTTTLETYTTEETIENTGLILHVADQNETYNKIRVYIDPMTGEALKIKPLYVNTQELAGAAINIVKDAINYVSTNRCNVGALQNRLEHTINGNNSTSENMTTSKSAIKDADMAKEMTEYTKMNVLTQASQAMLAQSNQSTQQVLSLLE